MRLKFDSSCIACPRRLPAGSEAAILKVGTRWNCLCEVCQLMTRRPGRDAQETIMAVLVFHEDPCLGQMKSHCRLSDEDRHDIRKLGLDQVRYSLLERVGLIAGNIRSALPF